MKLKYYLKGFGIGVIFATLILSISFYSRNNNSNHTSRQEIERLAAAYGMVYPQETTKEENPTSDKEELETLKESGTDKQTESAEAETNQETEGVGETRTNEETGTTEEMETNREVESTGETNRESESIREPQTSEESGSMEEASEEDRSIREIETDRENESVGRIESIGESQSVQKDTLIKETTITVVSGMYASSISELLEETGVIEDAEAFSLYLIGEGYTRRLQAGVYTFTEGMDFKTIAGKLLWETD